MVEAEWRRRSGERRTGDMGEQNQAYRALAYISSATTYTISCMCAAKWRGAIGRSTMRRLGMP
ncbi:hypothetical protein PsYK624_103780 [Phanerochaete sordida]|uniref:Uncharacterized protein n=1 Tax=Phanerochaete sordida TaxID=48140 RepID=A0A9P3LGD3_9APHY|nr:hypothetical protein PsYK624_103780 [Phanerochaete sordida]